MNAKSGGDHPALVALWIVIAAAGWFFYMWMVGQML
jgi:hypothetical protein